MSGQLAPRWPALVAAGLSLLILGLCYALPSYAAPPAPGFADVVVQYGDGQVTTRRVTFTGSISGLAALRASGLPLVEKNGAVCRIGDTGCRADQDCFCACPPPFEPCLSWGYYRHDGAAWQLASQGAGATSVANGAVEGWTWGRTLPQVTPPILGARAGLQWLRTLQLADGSFPGSGGNAGATLDSVLAVAAAGDDPSSWRGASGSSPLDYLRAQGPAYAARNVASAGKLALGLAAADLDPRSFAQMDLVISMTAGYAAATGAYGATNWDQALALLGLRAAGADIPPAAASRLLARANADGGWGVLSPGESDVDSTGLALEALAAAGVPSNNAAVLKALAYLDGAQNADGGFPNIPAADGSDTSNANSTAFAIQGLLAAGTDPLAKRWRPAATGPVSYLLTLQQPDGAFTFAGVASQVATQQVIPALLGRPFPYLGRAVAARAALAYIRAQQQPDGSFAGFGAGSTIDAVLAIRAAGANPRSFTSASGKSPLDYLAAQAASYAAGSVAASGKLMAGVVAAGADPRSFAGLNLVVSTTLRYNPATGAYGTTTWDQAWSMIGLAAVRQSIPISATERLQAIQATGGGWGFDAKAASADPDSTGLALMALAAAGVDRQGLSATAICIQGAGSSNPAVRAGLEFLRRSQNDDGGFPGFDGATSAGSTGLALQGLAAYGEAPRGLSWTTAITDGTASPLTVRDPIGALLKLQTAQGGFPGFGGPNDPSATYQALPGLLGRAFPVAILGQAFPGEPRPIYMPLAVRG